MVEAANHFRLDPTSIFYIGKVFDLLLLHWESIWIYNKSITVTKVGPVFGKSAKVQGQHWVGKAPLLHC